MTFRLLWLSVFFFNALAASTQEEVPEVPPGLYFPLLLERNFNVRDLIKGRFPPQTSHNVPIEVYEVPNEWAMRFEDPDFAIHNPLWSQWIDGEHHKTKLYLPFAHMALGEYAEMINKMRGLLKEHGIKASRTVQGSLLVSHFTWRIWDPDTKQNIFIKIRPENNETMHPDTSLSSESVAISRWIGKVFGDRDRSVGFYLPEPTAIEFQIPIKGSKKVLPYSIVFRSPEPVGFLYSPTASFLPLHGVMGNKDYLTELVTASGKENIRQWLAEEYAPKLAKFLAELQFRHGIFPESHTQNLLVHIDESTGKILGLGFRDMQDVSVDLFNRALRRRNTYFDVIRGLAVNQIFRSHVVNHSSPNGKNFRDGPLDIHKLFIVQALGGDWHYRMKDLMINPELNTEAYPETPADVFKRLYQYYANSILEPAASSRKTLEYEEFYTRVYKILSPELKEDATHYDQEYLREFVLRKNKEGQVAFAQKNSRLLIHQKRGKLKFTYDGHGVAIYYATTGTFLGYVHSLTESEKSEIWSKRTSPTCTLGNLVPLTP